MAHIDITPIGGSRGVLQGYSDPEWYGAAAQIARFMRNLTHIPDITAAIGPDLCNDMGVPGTAMYLPALHEAHVNSTTCLRGLRPSDVHFEDPMFKLRATPLIGVLIHEAGHAVASTWGMAEVRARVPGPVFDIVMLLEESRIEKVALDRFSGHDSRAYLNASALRIVMDDFELPDTVYGAAGATALILARYNLGILTLPDIEPVRDRVQAILPEGVLTRLESICRQFQRLDEYDVPTKGVELAEEWLALLKATDPELAENDPEPLFPSAHEDRYDGDPGEGDHGGDGDGSIMSRIRERTFQQDEARSKKIRQKHVEIEMSTRKELAEETKKATSALDQEKRRLRERAEHGLGDSENRYREAGAEVLGNEKVTTALRSAATKLSKNLERIQYEDVGRSRYYSQVPAGRLDLRRAQTADTQRDTGQMVTAAPWRSVRRQHTDTVPMSIGVMVDVSGSMNALARPMARLAWMLNYAAHRANISTATVLFGDSAAIYQMPHDQPPRETYPVWSPGGSIEAFSEGFSLVTGALDLINSRGARLLVIATDGHFVRRGETARTTKLMSVCRRAEIEVIWLPFSPDDTSSRYGYGEVVNSLPNDPTSMMLADVISSRAVRLLDRKKRQHIA